MHIKHYVLRTLNKGPLVQLSLDARQILCPEGLNTLVLCPKTPCGRTKLLNVLIVHAFNCAISKTRVGGELISPISLNRRLS